jgi:hypothetical protein
MDPSATSIGDGGSALSTIGFAGAGIGRCSQLSDGRGPCGRFDLMSREVEEGRAI